MRQRDDVMAVHVNEWMDHAQAAGVPSARLGSWLVARAANMLADSDLDGADLQEAAGVCLLEILRALGADVHETRTRRERERARRERAEDHSEHDEPASVTRLLNPPPGYLNLDQLAAALHLAPSTVLAKVRAGKLPAPSRRSGRSGLWLEESVRPHLQGAERH